MLRLAKKTAIVQQLSFILFLLTVVLLTTKGSEMLAFADIEILKKAMHNSFEKFQGPTYENIRLRCVGILCMVCVCGARIHTCFLFANAPFFRFFGPDQARIRSRLWISLNFSNHLAHIFCC